jgi:hypothetical protein
VMECDMDFFDQASDGSSNASIQDSTFSDEETFYELLFYDSDGDVEDEETEAFLQLLVTAAASDLPCSRPYGMGGACCRPVKRES